MDSNSETSLQEKLQGQVASSVKEALDKSTSILSNLHHLSTYLDVISKMAGSADRVKDAHDQIQNIRADCASLLQTMYLGEIGLQSLLDMLKTNGIAGLAPHIFSDALTGATPSVGADHASTLFDEDSVLGKHTSNDHPTHEEPPSKKSVVAVFVCNGCNHKFAINSDPSNIPSHCRNCRDGILSTDTAIGGGGGGETTPSQPNLSSSTSSANPPPSSVSKTTSPVVANNPNKQLKPKVTRRGKFNALICKLCGVSFFYRRCLLRHLRENHAQMIDVNNTSNDYSQFIETASKEEEIESPAYKGVVESHPSPQSNIDINVESQLSDTMDYGLQDMTGSCDQSQLMTGSCDQSQLMTGSCDQSQLQYDETDLSQTGLSQDDLNHPTDLGHHDLGPDASQLSQATGHHPAPPMSQSSLSLSNSSSVTDSIIEAVQNQAMLEQATALLSQSSTSIDTVTSSVSDATAHANSLLVQITPVSGSKGTSNNNNRTPQSGPGGSGGQGGDDGGSNSFREFKCTVCNKAFDRPYRLTRHLEIHDPNRPRIPCNYCSKTFTRKDSLESHIKTVHASVYPFTCSHEGCTRSFATRSMYLNHLKVHGENKPYHCQECSESFTLLAELKDHFKKEHPENESLRCTECFKVCSSQEELDEHKLRDHRFECENCGKVFARLAYLQTHVRVHNGESKFNCRFCSEGFNSAYSYRQHMKNHPEYRRIINVFPCHPCGKTFQEPKELIAHYETAEHKEKAANIDGAIGQSTATSLMEGDLSVMGELMTDQIINSIVSTHAGFDEISSSQT